MKVKMGGDGARNSTNEGVPIILAGYRLPFSTPRERIFPVG